MTTDNATEEIKQVTLGELRNTAFPTKIREALEAYSVVIFYGPNNPSGGSGTLVHYKGIKGILTASHVVAPISNRRSVFLPCFLRNGTNDVWDIAEAPFCQLLTIDDLKMYSSDEWIKNWSENGLDIALIQFEDKIFDEIIKHWKKQPLDLAEMRSKYLSHDAKYWAPENKHNWSWTLSGFPREGCHIIENNVNYFPNAGVYIGGGITKLRRNTLQNVLLPYQGMDVDVIETQLRPTQDLIPKDFSGASGGGFYQTSERQVGDQFKIEEILLAGVFISGDEEAGRLYSRGHIALYDIFCSFLDTLIQCGKCVEDDFVNNHKQWVGDVFNRKAAEYGKKSSAFFSYFGKRMVEYAEILTGQHVLDVATGRGAVLFPLAEAVGPLGKVVGIDISEQMIRETSKEVVEKNIHWIELQCMDAERLDFPDNYFDFVFCGFALFFLPSISTALSEFKRVLKSGGMLVVSTWGEDSKLDILINEEIKKYCNTNSLIATPLWSEKELRKAFQEAGLNDIQIFEENKLFLHRTAEEWWDSLWSHATRAKLEQLSADQIANLHKQVLKNANDLDEGQGVAEDLEVFYGIARKA